MNKSIKHNNGFSIVELLIVVGGLAGLALVSMSVTKMNTKSTAKFGQDSDIQSIVNELAGELSNPTKCTTALSGSNAQTSTNTISNINGKYYIVSDTNGAAGYGNSNLKISSYTLKATSAEVAAGTSYLILTYVNKNIIAGDSGPTTLTKKIKLNVTVNGSNNITDCRSIATTSDVWVRGVGTIISYTAGNVGIGTAAPTERLEINGTLKTTDFQLTSDRKFKTQIESLNAKEELGKILKLRPVTFTWKENGRKDQGF
ncbi:MAG: tail fiber domain-containing protein, partial [Bdellovibrionales bacterium]|nr:tail fiber domain-containing protein [Bdellovibrionales bacterium]